MPCQDVPYLWPGHILNQSLDSFVLFSEIIYSYFAVVEAVEMHILRIDHKAVSTKRPGVQSSHVEDL